MSANQRLTASSVRLKRFRERIPNAEGASPGNTKQLEAFHKKWPHLNLIIT